MKRLLTAAVLVPIIVYVVLFANQWVFFAVLAAVALLCFREYEGIAGAHGIEGFGPLAGMSAAEMKKTKRNEPQFSPGACVIIE